MSTKCREKMQLIDLSVRSMRNGGAGLIRIWRSDSEHAFVAKTEITVVADNDVIENAYAHDFADFF